MLSFYSKSVNLVLLSWAAMVGAGASSALTSGHRWLGMIWKKLRSGWQRCPRPRHQVRRTHRCPRV